MNSAIFRSIDTEEKAYWLGFLSADGSIYCRQGRNKIQLCLASRDEAHVIKWKNYVQSDNSIHRFKHFSPQGKPCFASSFAFSSVEVVQDLARLKVVEKKSLTLEPWQDCQGPLARHYWRGMVDGDGCLFQTGAGKHGITLVGSLDTILAFETYIKGISPTRASPLQRGSIWGISVQGVYAAQIIKHLYEGAEISLDRKMLLAKTAFDEGAKKTVARQRKEKGFFAITCPTCKKERFVAHYPSGINTGRECRRCAWFSRKRNGD